MAAVKVSGDTLVTLAVGVAAGLAVLYAVRRLQSAAASAADLPSRVVESIVQGVGDAVDYIAGLPGAAVNAAVEAVQETRQVIADSNPTNPGAGLPPGWYRVKTRWGEVVTRNPDAFKTINPYDTLGLIDP